MTERTPPLVLAARALAILALLVAGCEKSPFESEREIHPPADPSPAASARSLELDAGFALERSDPLPPAGDLKQDVERFSTLDSCVAQHALLDPVVGDAVRSIGYDTLLRDACRVLQALKMKDTSPCAAIAASTLQNRCQSLVAMALQDPERCPWYSAADKELGRDPMCLGVATHDPRTCAAAPEGSIATCEALSTGDASRCGKATGDELATCTRELQREKTLLAGEHDVHETSAPSAHLEIHGADAKDASSADVDLSPSVLGGAVVSSAALGGVSFELARDLETTLRLPARAERPHLTASIAFESGAARVTKLVLAVPKLPELSCANAHCTLAVTAPKVDPKRGAPLVVTFEGTIEAPGATYRVNLKIETFVRDVVGRAALYGGR